MRTLRKVAPISSRQVAQQDDPWRRNRPTATIVLNSLDDVVPMSGENAAAVSLWGESLWNATRVAREKKDVRGNNKVFVTGGASAIQRIWHTYGIRPNVVFAPDTETDLPDWCHHPTLPSIIVRAPPVQINRTLLSAERSDGYAAEFPTPIQAPLAELINPSAKLKSLLVLHRVRIPSNVGALVRSAVNLGYDAVLLDRCADMLSEKVVRASDGTVVSPLCKIVQTNESSFSAIQQAAVANRLLPLFAVPSQAAEDVFSVAKTFHTANIHHRSMQGDPSMILGPMLVLGSESEGLRELQQQWSIPVKLVSVAIGNAQIDSINVAVAGSILMNHFQPAADVRFRALSERHAQLEKRLLEMQPSS